MCTVEDVAQEVGVFAVDVRGAAAETLDAASGVVAVAGSGADVGLSGLSSPFGHQQPTQRGARRWGGCSWKCCRC